MTSNATVTVLHPLLFAVMASFFVVIGLRGMVFRKPFLISGRWSFTALWLGCSSSNPLLAPLWRLGDECILFRASAIEVALSGILVIIVALLLVNERDAIGITASSLRYVLLASLKSLNLPYEENGREISLPTREVVLGLDVSSWLGLGVLYAKGRGSPEVPSDIVQAMNEHYQKGAFAGMSLTFIVLIVVGALDLFFALREIV
ncbi:MAG: hypothetical protein V2B18_01475 [Pseudomonadota bacterium]